MQNKETHFSFLEKNIKLFKYITENTKNCYKIIIYVNIYKQ